MITTLRNIARSRRILGAAIAVAALGGTATVAYARTHVTTVQYRTTTVAYGTITQTLGLSGNLAPASVNNLDFTTQGMVTAVNVVAGQAVAAGAVLATEDTTTLASQLLQAESNLATSEAKLTADSAPPTAAALALAQSAVASAQLAVASDQANVTVVADTNQGLVAAAQQQLTVALARENAAQTAVQGDQQALNSAEQQQAQDCQSGSSSQQCQDDNRTTGQDQTKLNQDQATLTQAQATVSNSTDAALLAQARSDQANAQAAAQLLKDQQAVTTANTALNTLEQGPTSLQLSLEQSQVAVAQQAADNAQKALEGATITAPLAGVITSVGVTTGQAWSGATSGNATGGAAGAGSAHAVVLTVPGAFQVTGSVSDTQVGQIVLGQSATVTPAGATQALFAKVTSIASSATISSGVATFPVTVTITDPSNSLHSGASATVTIILNQVVHVLTVPTSAVRGGGSVQVLVNGKPQSVTVTTGAADATRTQILSGLNLGDTVVLATVTSTVPATGGGGGAGNILGGGGGGRGGGGGFGGGAPAGG
ncbi:MAG: efflux RND transporter periplasmic adaptor subunit [Candidatus Dormibacteria bacterium]